MIQESVSLAGKTTLRIGGTARFFAECKTREDIEAAWAFAKERDLPVIPLGSGSNTIFADGTINAVVVRIAAEDVTPIVEENDQIPNPNDQSTPENIGHWSLVIGHSTHLRVQAGKNLPMLVNECAARGFDLSPLTGIPGTLGGAIVGNAGQGPGGIWLDSFIVSVTGFRDGAWEELSREQCDFGYRESRFKHGPDAGWIVWEAELAIPQRDPAAIQADIEALLQKRIATQPHRKTAGSIFKATGDTPAWKLIDAAGLRGLTIGGAQIAEKHANFMLNTGSATYADAKAIVERVRATIPEPLDVEMRFYEEDGGLGY